MIILLKLETENMEGWGNLEYSIRRDEENPEEGRSERGKRKDKKYIQEKAIPWPHKEKNPNRRDLINDKYFREVTIWKSCLPYQNLSLKMDQINACQHVSTTSSSSSSHQLYSLEKVK